MERDLILEEFLREFEVTLLWITNRIPNWVLDSKNISDFASRLATEEQKEFEKLESINKMSLAVLNSFKENPLALWYSIGYDSFGNPEEILNLDREIQLREIARKIRIEFLYTYYKKYGLNFDYQKAKLLLKAWFEHLSSNLREYEEEIPILNLEIESDQIRLSEDMILKKLSKQEISDRVKWYEFDFGHFGFETLEKIIKSETVLVRRWKEDIRHKEIVNTGELLFNRVMAIFRLIQPEWVAGGSYIHAEELSTFYDMGWRYFRISNVKQTRGIYKLSLEKENEFITE